MNSAQLRLVWEKTNGHCHFCGDPVEFEKYGRNGGDGAWVLDHIAQKGRGGSKSVENCLAACATCNRFRWHRSGTDIRELIFLGLVARDEINKKTSATGKNLVLLRDKWLAKNELRLQRKKTSQVNVAEIEDEAVE